MRPGIYRIWCMSDYPSDPKNFYNDAKPQVI